MRIRVSVTFPEVSAAHACHEVVLDVGNFRIAVNRGLMQILNNPHLKRRRIRTGMIRFARLDIPDKVRRTANGNGGTP
jgi:hypothetical protein